MPTCWGITSGQAGMVAQVKALAQALELQPLMKKADIRAPSRYLPNMCFPPLRNAIIPFLIADGSDPLAPPYPDVVISCGRRAALVAMGLKARAPKLTTIHIQDPQMSPEYFSMVVAMQHDKVQGYNVLKTRYALHSITPDSLRKAREAFAPVFVQYPGPRIAVLVGGSTNKYSLTTPGMDHVIRTLQHILGQTEGSLLITPSRRTGEQNIARLRKAFEGNARVYIYDFVSENPYMGLLALADYIVVTNDSVNMMSEAHATGKPLYILSLLGHRETKPANFAEKLIADGIAKIAGEPLQSWAYPKSNEMQEIAGEIRDRLLHGR